MAAYVRNKLYIYIYYNSIAELQVSPITTADESVLDILC